MKFNAVSFNITTSFSSCTKAGKGFNLFNQWIKKAKYGTFEKNEGENGDYRINGLSLKDGDCFFMFNVESDSSENIYWQLDNIKKFMQTVQGITSFNADVLLKDRSVTWNND